MSGSHQCPRCSQHQSSCLAQSSSDPASLVEKPQETAQALRNFGKTPDTAPLEDASNPEKVSCPIEEGYRRGEFHEECRCFRLPRSIVRREYELLQEHKLEKFSHLVNRVYEDLAATILLMRNLDAGAELSGYDIYLISQNLSRPLDLLNTICSQLADCELIRKTTVPA